MPPGQPYRRWGRADRVMHRLGSAPRKAAATAAAPVASEPAASELQESGHSGKGVDQKPEWGKRWGEPDDRAPRLFPVSPAQERRLGERLKACAGITAAVVAALVTAVFLWRAVQGLPQALAGAPKASVAARATALATPLTNPPAAGGAAASTPARALPPAPSPTAGQPRTIVIAPQAAAQTPPSVEATNTPASTAGPASPTQAAPTAAPEKVVPTVAGTPPIARATLAATPGRTATRAPSTEQRIHTVERGDTLFSIARRNGTTVEALVEVNGLGSRDATLGIGRRLVLP